MSACQVAFQHFSRSAFQVSWWLIPRPSERHRLLRLEPSFPRKRKSTSRRPYAPHGSGLLLNWRSCWYLAEAREGWDQGQDRGRVRGTGFARGGGVQECGLRHHRRPGQGRVARRGEAERGVALKRLGDEGDQSVLRRRTDADR